jgi:hypothetical protein
MSKPIRRLVIKAWVSVIEGMFSGALQVGSRTPVASAPNWATLEVAHGGFATGELLAGGTIQPHERELLSRLPTPREGAERITINSYFLSDEGITELQRLLKSGCYRVAVPEEGALLVIAWLLGRGEVDSARAVLDEVGPFMSRLRFYPVPDSRPPTVGSVVHLQDIRQTIQDLSAIRAPSAILALREAIRVWAPLCDRVVELFIETVRGPIPTLRLDLDGKPLKTPEGKFVIEGGWPCQVYPDGSQARATALLEEYRRLRSEHQRCRKPDHRKRSFACLCGYLETCVRDPGRLIGRDVGLVRLLLAGSVVKRRSLLLLNLQSQTRFDELPWVRVVDSCRQNDLNAREHARQTLEQVVALAITAFPEKILPNKLLQEIQSLVDGAGLEAPIVDELAAGIFVGDFSEKFVRSAQKAGELLTGTLYERYYGVPYARVRAIDDVKPSRYGTATSQAYVRLCIELAGEAEGGALVGRAEWEDHRAGADSDHPQPRSPGRYPQNEEKGPHRFLGWTTEKHWLHQQRPRMSEVSGNKPPSVDRMLTTIVREVAGSVHRRGTIGANTCCSCIVKVWRFFGR